MLRLRSGGWTVFFEARKNPIEQGSLRGFALFSIHYSTALRLFGDVQVRELQDRAVTVKHRKELLRQKYVSERGPISAKEFDEFMMTSEYAEFLLAQRQEKNAARLSA